MSLVPLVEGKDRDEIGANGFSRPIGSAMTSVEKSLRLLKAGSVRIVPSSLTARRVRSVATRPCSAGLPEAAIDFVTKLEEVDGDNPYQTPPATRMATL